MSQFMIYINDDVIFSPQIGGNSWSGLPFVFERVRLNKKTQIIADRFIRIFADEGCRSALYLFLNMSRCPLTCHNFQNGGNALRGPWWNCGCDTIFDSSDGAGAWETGQTLLLSYILIKIIDIDISIDLINGYYFNHYFIIFRTYHLLPLTLKDSGPLLT